jgi:signal transduction histidine kinase
MTAPLAAVSFLLLLLGTVTAWYVQRLQKNAADILALNVSSIRAAEELEIGVREIRTRINQYLLTGDRKHLAAVPVQRQQTDRWLREAVRLATTEREQELMTALQHAYQRFLAEFDQLVAAEVDADSREELRELVEADLTQDILHPAHEYLDLNEQMIAESSQAGQILANRMVLCLLLLGTCGPVAGLLAGFVVSRRVSRTLVELNVPVRDAAGRLSDVVGPITFAGPGLEELPALAQGLAAQVAAVVERLQQSQQEVLRSEQLAAVGQLAAGVAHELRNPLQSMQLLVQSAVAEGEAGCLRGRDLDVLQEAVDRVKRSVQAFLDFARPPALEKQAVDLKRILRQTVELVTGRARRQGACLSCDAPDEPVVVEADPDQMRQLVLNLLLNALDAVSTGGHVSVSLRELRHEAKAVVDIPGEEGAAADVCLEVADDGCGLPGELGDRIFEPFVTTKETGTGLGLAICRRITEAHGGELRAANRSPTGSMFTVRLPTGGKQAISTTLVED